MVAPKKPEYGDTLEAQMVVDYVSEGMTLVDACRTLGIAYRTIYDRIRDHPKFAEMMETARANGYEVIANDVRRVARGEEGYSTKDPKRDRLVVETELKLLAKWHPTRYGEKLQIESRNANVEIPVGEDPIAAQKAYEELMKG